MKTEKWIYSGIILMLNHFAKIIVGSSSMQQQSCLLQLPTAVFLLFCKFIFVQYIPLGFGLGAYFLAYAWGGDCFSQQLDSIKQKFIEKQPYLNVLKSNPFPILTGPLPVFTSEYRLAFEYVTGPQTASQISFSYLDKNIFIRNFIDTSNKFLIRGFRFQATFKFYLNEVFPAFSVFNDYNYSPNGLYVAPHISYAYAKGSTAFWNSLNVFVRGTQFNTAVLAGYQFVVSDAIAIDVFSGAGYKLNEFYLNIPNKSRQLQIKDIYGDTFFTTLLAWPVKLYLGFNAGVVF